ncbi:MAG: radical SAM protein [Candidatus Helarchaeota archaeon]|nr:radical SAM protein [Candidatus Helarchaeota archaeon]
MCPNQIRVSAGTAAVLGLIQMQLDAIPTTAYLMLYTTKRCLANCAFCPQARESKARPDALARILWPEFNLQEVRDAIKTLPERIQFERICIQAINYLGFFTDLVETVETLKDLGPPLSVSVPPLKIDQMKTLHEKGVNRIGIPLDAATEPLFYDIKGKGSRGPYNWEKHLGTIKEAQSIFGIENVSTHLIVGLGETEFEAIKFLAEMINSQVLPALFTFTPVRGTALEKRARPSLKQYRKIQIARYLLVNKLSRFENFTFNEEGELIKFGIPKEKLKEIIRTGTPFLTTGCPGCNRPFYNERPGETLFNYPRAMNNDEIAEVIKVFEEVGQ